MDKNGECYAKQNKPDIQHSLIWHLWPLLIWVRLPPKACTEPHPPTSPSGSSTQFQLSRYTESCQYLKALDLFIVIDSRIHSINIHRAHTTCWVLGMQLWERPELVNKINKVLHSCFPSSREDQQASRQVRRQASRDGTGALKIIKQTRESESSRNDWSLTEI